MYSPVAVRRSRSLLLSGSGGEASSDESEHQSSQSIRSMGSHSPGVDSGFGSVTALTVAGLRARTDSGVRVQEEAARRVDHWADTVAVAPPDVFDHGTRGPPTPPRIRASSSRAGTPPQLVPRVTPRTAPASSASGPSLTPRVSPMLDRKGPLSGAARPKTAASMKLPRPSADAIAAMGRLQLVRHLQDLGTDYTKYIAAFAFPPSFFSRVRI